MQFENDFVVPVPPARAWDVLLDLDQVAQCMPGATLLDSDGQNFTGKVNVRVGPIKVGYQGTAQFVEKDEAGHRAVLRASGREERGAGTAGATVTATLHPEGAGHTRVRVLTDLDITGKPAQFGRGVMAEVGTGIINQFAKRLAQRIEADSSTAPNGAALPTTSNAAAAPSPAAATAASPTSVSVADDGDALDMGLLVWKPMIKRIGPVAGGILGLVVLWRLLTGRQPKTPQIVVVFGPTPGQH
ncbi:MAG TPA: SRPBCC family protein [Actinomycetales bacterium]|jgi:carbon monoxide dehydrogenase subunit G|nr:SRPBCC family protein [Actinomycetales bacterium]